MVEPKSELRGNGVLRNTTKLCFALVLLTAAACGDDSNPSEGPQGEAGRAVNEAGRGGKSPGSAGTGGAGGTSSPRPAGSSGSAGTGRAGTGGSAGTSAANGGGGASEAGRGGNSGGAGSDGSAGTAGEGGSHSETPSASEIASAIAKAICGALEACVGPQKLAALNQREDCVSRFTASLTQDDFGSLQASIEAGTVKLDPSRLQSCYDDTRALGCKVQTERLPASCAAAIAGQQAAGETCSTGADCETGTFCPIDAECPRACEPTRDEGADCARDGECQRGTICHAGVCAAPALKGQACAGNSGATCAIGLSCVGSTDTQAGTSQDNATVQAGAMGAVCIPGGTLCREGLSCAFDSGATFKCVGPVEQGDTCKLALPTQCPLDSYCDAADVTVSGTCRPLPTDGMACVLGDDCAPGHVCVSQDDVATCAKIGDLGEPCVADALCRSGSCEAGSCALRARCE